MDAEQKPFMLRRTDDRHVVYLGGGDYVLLGAYADLRAMSLTRYLHDMIGTAIKCWEEKHDDRLKKAEAEAKQYRKDAIEATRIADIACVSLSTSSKVNKYYFILSIFLLCVFLQWRIVNSPFGKVME